MVPENEVENALIPSNPTDQDIKNSKTDTFGQNVKNVGCVCFVLLLAAIALVTIGLEFSVGKFSCVDLKKIIFKK